MAIINYKPTTNARRNMSTTDFSALSKTGPEKSLLAPKNKADYSGPPQYDNYGLFRVIKGCSREKLA